MALVSSLAATGGLSFAMATTSHPSAVGTVSGIAGTAGGAATAPSAGTPDTATATAAFTDGTYTGSEVTNRYGPVQVQVTVTGGNVSAVALLVSPGDHKSQRINAQAAPVLEQEAVAAQSSTLDIVSGATYTTRSYATSLQAALDQASTSATAAATPISTGSR